MITKKTLFTITCDLSRQKELDPNPRISQQLECIFMLDAAPQVLKILDKLKETKLQFSKGTTKVL